MNRPLIPATLMIGIASLMMLASCGMKTGFIRDARSAQVVKFEFPVRGMRFIRTVSGSAHYWSVFCIIPLGEDLYNSAMRRLYAEAELRPNQSVVNLREDFKFLTYLFACKYKLTVSGDLVQFYPRGGGRAQHHPGRVSRSRPVASSRRDVGRVSGVGRRAAEPASRVVPAKNKPAPTIIDMAPTFGPAGTRITIVGRHLDNVDAVWISHRTRGKVKLKLTRKSSRRIYATVPASASSGAIVVETSSRYITTSYSFVVRQTAPATPPPVENLPETLSAKEIRAVMVNLARSLRRCFRRNRARGVIKLRITLEGRSGLTSKVKPVGRYRHSNTARCAAKAVSGTFFGRFKAERQTFTYPVRYR